MQKRSLVEDTSSGAVAAFTTGGPVKQPVRKTKEGKGLKPDALTRYVSGWKKR